ILVQLADKEATPDIVGPLQTALSQRIPGAIVLVHQLETNPVEFPVEVRVATGSDINAAEEGADIENLRVIAGRVRDVLRRTPGTLAAQDDWFVDTPEVRLEIDSERANLSGITNDDVAASTQTALTGMSMTTLHDGDHVIPVIARLVPQQR